MKFAKLFPAFAAFTAMFAMSACSDDVTDPKYHEPDASDFSIYTPAFQNEYYELTPEGTFTLTLSGQPDYGFSAITQYRAEVSLTPDFAEFRTLIPTGSGTLSNMTLKDNDLAMALCALHGVETEEDYKDLGPQVVYFRGSAFIDQIEGSYVTTKNVVSLNRVQSYLALPIPAVIWCIGNYVGTWIDPLESKLEELEPYQLSEKEDEIGSNKYYGTIDFQPTNVAEGCIFRFYTALGSWDENSLGCAGGTDSDTPVEFPDFIAGTTLEHALASTKDSFQFPNYTGKLEFFVDLSDSANPKITITAPAQ
ncbi:MAG: hypothetical protein K2I69_05415 [Muribaculaceae bacterium]|nr:hypothetical protein [Muribaculaceae bacterium]MDE6575322.1 hypothetical protein [Muribaculaceae bacterium]